MRRAQERPRLTAKREKKSVVIGDVKRLAHRRTQDCDANAARRLCFARTFTAITTFIVVIGNPGTLRNFAADAAIRFEAVALEWIGDDASVTVLRRPKQAGNSLGHSK